MITATLLTVSLWCVTIAWYLVEEEREYDD